MSTSEGGQVFVPELGRDESAVGELITLTWGTAVVVRYAPSRLRRFMMMAVLRIADDPDYRVRVAANDGSTWARPFADLVSAEQYAAGLANRPSVG